MQGSVEIFHYQCLATNFVKKNAAEMYDEKQVIPICSLSPDGWHMIKLVRIFANKLCQLLQHVAT